MLLDQNRKTLSDKWFELIYSKLELINIAYVRMIEGCKDIEELIEATSLNQEIIDRIKYKNASLLLTYLTNVLSMARVLFTKEEYNSLNHKIKILVGFHQNGLTSRDGITTKAHEVIFSDRTKSNVFTLNNNFNYLIKCISEVYNQVIVALTDILYMEGNIKNK